MTTFALVGKRLIVGTAQGPSVDEYDHAGKVLRRLELPIKLRPTSREAQERVVDLMLDAVGAKGVRREQQRDQLLRAPVPKHHAPYRDVRAAPNGVVWVSTGSPQDGDSTTTLTALALDGRVVTQRTLPFAGRLLWAGDDHLMLSYESPDAEPLVAVYKLRRR